MPDELPHKRRDLWWKKHLTFRTDSLVDEILTPGWDDLLSTIESVELAKDFNILKNKFRNMVCWFEAGEYCHDELLEAINHKSDEELLAWRKERNDKIAADMKMVEDIWNEVNTDNPEGNNDAQD